MVFLTLPENICTQMIVSQYTDKVNLQSNPIF